MSTTPEPAPLARLPGASMLPGTLRARFSRLLAAAVVVPALLFGTMQLVSDVRTAESNLREQLRLATRLSATSIDPFIQEHASAVGLVAEDASVHGETPRLAMLRERYPAFVTVLSTDADGRIVAVAPAARGIGAAGRRVDDRDYFRGAKLAMEPYVSNAFVGRGLGTEPLVAVSAPIIAGDRFAGVVEGSIRVDAFTRLRSAILRTRRQEMLIVDRDGRVVHASDGLPQAFLDRVGGACFLRGKESLDGVSPARLCRGVLRDGGDAWTAWTQLHSGWRMALFSPHDVVYSGVRRQAISMLGVLVLAVSGALLMVRWQMDRLERAAVLVLERLRATATGTGAGDLPMDAIPPELRPVIEEVSRLATRLDAANDELRGAVARERRLAASLREAIDRQEQDIQARTLELRAADLELERVSRTDALTGVSNVRGFRTACDELADGAGALHAPLAVIAFDVDRFKPFNDLYGHPLGDRVLRRVAGAAQACLRDASDRVARVGGEEFVVLMPGADAAMATALAERIREAVLALGIPHRDSPAGCVSVSLGVLAAARGELLDGLLAHADEALYRAKSAGRNRVST